jgi:two-component system nitrogen regulation sensor histidine kinase GlnL
MAGGRKEHIVDWVDDGIIVLDTQLKIQTFNQAAERITGFSKRSALGHPIHDTFRRNPQIVAQLRRTLDSGQTSLNHDAPFLTRDGETRFISLTCSPISDRLGRRLGVAAVFKDRTMVREMEERARHSDNLRLLATMTAGIAHEVKNPLGGIRGAAQILRKAAEEGEGDRGTLVQCADLVIQQVDRIDRLIEDLLDLSSPKKLRIEPVNIHKVLNDLIHLLRAETDEEIVAFETAFDPSLPPVRGDEARLSQVFLNLLRNASDAVREQPKGGAVQVRTGIDLAPRAGRSDRASGPTIAVEITDDGPGIRAEDLGNLFAPFFTTKARGSGLGLAVSHKLVEDHGGALKLSSRYGRGTTVRVTLPAVEES